MSHPLRLRGNPVRMVFKNFLPSPRAALSLGCYVRKAV